MLPGGLCHLKSIFNLSELFRNVIFPAAKLTQSLLLTLCDEIYITKKYFWERTSSLIATPPPHRKLSPWMLVNSTRVCAIALHLLSPWSSACFHLHPNPPLHLKVRMTALAHVPSLCLCSLLRFSTASTCSWSGEAAGRRVEAVVVTPINYFVTMANT